MEEREKSGFVSSNPLIDGVPFMLGPYRANGFSVGTRCTWLVMPSFGLVFDVGWPVEPMRRVSRAFITHLHQDHCAGLPLWVVWRQSFISDEGPPMVYVPKDTIDLARGLIEAASLAEGGERLQYEVIGLDDGDVVDLGKQRCVRAFATRHQVPTLGFSILEVRNRLKQEYRELRQSAIVRAREAGETVTEKLEVLLVSYVGDSRPEVFDDHPELLQSQVLVSECSLIDGSTEYRPAGDGEVLRENASGRRHHSHIHDLAVRLERFTGEQVFFSHVPAKYTSCDLRALMLPRVPPAIRARLGLLPYRSGTASVLPAEPADVPAWPGPIDSMTGIPVGWVPRERGRYAGYQRKKRHDELHRKYGNYVIGHRWGEEIVQRSEALQFYEDAYFAFLERQPELVEWLVSTAADVYDTSAGNIRSGTDYFAQGAGPTHLQDVAVRRCLLRLGVWFHGERLVQIRGLQSEGYVLNPGIVPFHRPERICQPEWRADWCLPGSVESFWQSNKVVLAPCPCSEDDQAEILTE